jgi:uncharacterized cupin superfamily protein
MSNENTRAAVDAASLPLRPRPTSYPPALAHLVAGREKRALGDAFGLTAFGVNLVRLAPGAHSAFRHRHTRQQEFLYVLEGEPTLVTDEQDLALRPGMCAGFLAGGAAHQLVNRSGRDVVYLEVGDRVGGDTAEYPYDDVALSRAPDGTLRFFTHKDGTPY